MRTTIATAFSPAVGGAFGSHGGGASVTVREPFVVDRSDKIADQHGGGHEGMDALAADLHTAKEIHQDLPQTYSAGPGNVIGQYLVRRIRTARGGYKISKSRTGP